MEAVEGVKEAIVPELIYAANFEEHLEQQLPL